MRAVLSFLLFATSAGASEYFATNLDGSVLYFSSPLRQKGTSQAFHDKIFVWEQGRGIRLYEQRESGASYFLLDRIQVSADGLAVAVVAERDCSIADCSSGDRYQTTVHRAGQPDLVLAGDAVLSSNGRYLLLAASDSPGEIRYSHDLTLVDLTTGIRTAYSGAFRAPESRLVADDGTVLLSNAAGLALGRNGELAPLGVLASFGLLNATAGSVVYSLGFFGTPLYASSTASTNPVLLAESFNGFGAVLTSREGDVVVYAEGARVWTVRADGSGRRLLGTFAEVASLAALSGDGKIVFLTVGDADAATCRIVRIDTATGEQAEIVPAMPAAIGRVTAVRGGFLRVPWFADPAGVTVRINGRAAPLAVAPAGSLVFQVPWDLPPGESQMEIEGPYLSSSLFSAGAALTPALPGFVTATDESTYAGHCAPAIIVAAHQDFSAAVTDAAPAHAGEVVHLYAQNLGTVSEFPAPGVAAAASPLTSPLTCTAAGTAAEVLFAGLAPGLFGTYQIDLRMPAPSGTVVTTVRCKGGVEIAGYLPLR